MESVSIKEEDIVLDDPDSTVLKEGMSYTSTQEFPIAVKEEVQRHMVDGNEASNFETYSVEKGVCIYIKENAEGKDFVPKIEKPNFEDGHQGNMQLKGANSKDMFNKLERQRRVYQHVQYQYHFCCHICDRKLKTKSAYVTHLKSHKVPESQVKFKRMGRRCPYCGLLQTRLPIHLERMHRDKTEVGLILTSKLSRRQQRKEFTLIRNEGNLIPNQEEIGDPTSTFAGIEKIEHSEMNIVHCLTCQGVYNASYFILHKMLCQPIPENAKSFPKLVNTSCLPTLNEEDIVFADLLLRFSNDQIGNLCCNDSTIKFIGRHLLEKRTNIWEKTHDALCRDIMADMRIIATLFSKFKTLSDENYRAKDAIILFHTHSWKGLCEAIQAVAHSESNERGLGKHKSIKKIYNFLHEAAYILERQAQCLGGEGGALPLNEIVNFQKLLMHNQLSIFRDSEQLKNYSKGESLQIHLKPLAEEIKALRIYSIARIKLLVKTNITKFNKTQFIELMELVCSRITLFNERRGNEHSMLTITDWTERNKWVDESALSTLNKAEKNLFHQMEVIFRGRNSSTIINTMIPRDCVDAIEILCDSAVRRRAGVSPENKFIFPNTEQPLSYCCGWICTNFVCEVAGIHCPELHVSSQREKMSKMYAALDVIQSNLKYFYSNISHSLNAGIMKWSGVQTDLVRVGFKKYLFMPSISNQLPGKREVLRFMRDKEEFRHLPYEKVRMKIMEELNVKHKYY